MIGRGGDSRSLGGGKRQKKATKTVASVANPVCFSPQILRVVSSPSVTGERSGGGGGVASLSDQQTVTLSELDEGSQETGPEALQEEIDDMVVELATCKSSQRLSKLSRFANFISCGDSFKRISLEIIPWKVGECIETLSKNILRGRGSRVGVCLQEALISAKCVIVLLLCVPEQQLETCVSDDAYENLAKSCVTIVEKPTSSETSPVLISECYHILGELYRLGLISDEMEMSASIPDTSTKRGRANKMVFEVSEEETRRITWLGWWKAQTNAILSVVEPRGKFELDSQAPSEWEQLLKEARGSHNLEHDDHFDDGEEDEDVSEDISEEVPRGTIWTEHDVWTVEGICLGLSSLCCKFDSSAFDLQTSGSMLRFIWDFIGRLGLVLYHSVVDFFNLYIHCLPPGSVSTKASSNMTGLIHLIGICYDKRWQELPEQETIKLEWFDNCWRVITGLWCRKINISTVQSTHSLNKKYSKEFAALLRSLNGTVESGSGCAVLKFKILRSSLQSRLGESVELVSGLQQDFAVEEWELLYLLNTYKEYSGNQSTFWFAQRHGHETTVYQEHTNHMASDKARSLDRSSRRRIKTMGQERGE